MNIQQNFRFLSLALKYPKISLSKFSSFFNFAPVRKAAFPELIAISLFQGCNLTCKMCGQWRLRKTIRADYLPAAQWKAVFEELARHRSSLYLWGGEPTLHPEFSQILDMIGTMQITCTINTNGTLLTRYADKIVQADIASLDVSIDGPEEIHDEIRGVTGLYKNILAGIRSVKDAAARIGRKGPLIKAVVTYSEWNVNSVMELVRDLQRVPAIDIIILQLGWFIPSEAGKSYENRLKKEFGIDAVRWRGFENNDSGLIAESVLQSLVAILDDRRLFKPVLLFPDLGLKNINAYYHKFFERFGRNFCRSIYRELHILADGKVALCFDWPDLILGDLKQQTIKQVWDGQQMQQLEKSLNEKGLFSVCSRCCSLFR